LLLFVCTARGEDVIDYDTGIEKAAAYIRQGDLQRAENTVASLLRRYPDNRELLTMMARLHFWQKRYDESLRLYDQLAGRAVDEALVKERERVANAKALSEADAQTARGDVDNAEKILRGIYESGNEQYESGRRLGMLYVGQRDYAKACGIFRELVTLYPDDLDLRGLLIDSLILKGELSKARNEFHALPQDKKARLSAERDDLLFRLNRNYVKLLGSFYEYTSGFSEEKWISLEVSQRIRALTLVIAAADVHRFGLRDSQLGLEVYLPLGENAKRWGYLSVSTSPDHEFLPETTLGCEVYQGYRGVEFSLGYRRMNFTDASVDIIMPGLMIYLSRGFTLSEKLYLVPEDWTFTLVSTLHYEPHHRLKGFFSMAVGNAAEVITSLQDTQKVATLGGTLGGEYRWSPTWSAGVELSGEYRDDLYSKYGLLLFTRFWW
jgi:YaiO family outer membrane protein